MNGKEEKLLKMQNTRGKYYKSVTETRWFLLFHENSFIDAIEDLREVFRKNEIYCLVSTKVEDLS